jgi:hypothetical protein
LGIVAVVARLLTSWVSTVVGIEACGQATVSYHVATPGDWRGTVTINTEVQESMSSTITTTDNGVTTVTTRDVRTSADVTDVFYLGGTEDATVSGYVGLGGRGYTHGAAVSEEGSATVNAVNYSCGTYDRIISVQSGGGWSFDGDASGNVSLYPGGKYTVSWTSLASRQDVELPGERRSEVSASSSGLCPAAVSTSKVTLTPPHVYASVISMVEADVDPANPGNRLHGSKTVVNDDLSVTTITWDLSHDGPIRFPGG